MTALIISGGDYAPVSGRDYGFVVACDRGWLHAQRMGIRPGLILGDFDSAPVPEGDIPVEIHPRQKDDTDTMLAMKKTLAQDCGEITVACAFGGRLDHTLANIQTAAWLAERGMTVRLAGADAEAAVFPSGTLRFPRREGRSLSLFSLSDRCEGVRIRGTKYEGQGLTLTNAIPLGVSNVWTTEEAEITVKTGILLVMQSGLKKGEHI